MKKIFSLLIITVICIYPVFASAEIPSERQLPLLVDDAGLLNDTEYSNLLEKLEEISERQKCEVAVVTVDTVGNSSVRDYADDVYDYYGYGYGENDDGILLLINMGSREWWITTYGYGSVALTDYGITQIENSFLSYLSGGEYYSAFEKFAELCDSYIGYAKDGSPIDHPNSNGVQSVYNEYTPVYEYNAYDRQYTQILPSLVIGFIIALIATGVMRGKLKSVRSKANASDYTVSGSMNVTRRHDMFLYRNISKTPRPRDNGPSGRSGASHRGGSSMHTSSSGRSHGGGGGRF